MKSHNKILIAFILNLLFSLFEFFGGIFTGSIAVISDSVHDFGDAASIGISFFLEKKSKKGADKRYTYGYALYSVLGALITGTILVAGGIVVIFRAIGRIITPCEINYDGMMILAVVGAVINLAAAYFTHGGHSLNQRTVSLHMLEDVLGWLAVLISAVIIKLTGFVLLDPIISICVSLFIIINAVRLLNESLEIFLVKAPKHIDIDTLAEEIQKASGVLEVHHLHLWQLDSEKSLATMHVVTDGRNDKEVKHKVHHICEHFGIFHSTLEIEDVGEVCHNKVCTLR